jgi:hypothetical protein
MPKRVVTPSCFRHLSNSSPPVISVIRSNLLASYLGKSHRNPARTAAATDGGMSTGCSSEDAKNAKIIQY